jgi:hypothetical protein
MMSQVQFLKLMKPSYFLSHDLQHGVKQYCSKESVNPWGSGAEG